MFKNNLKSEEEKKYLFKKQRNDEKHEDFKSYGSVSSNDDTSHLYVDDLDTTVYPSGVIFVLLSKCFEASAANGIRSVLGLFLRDTLFFNERFSTVILHTFNFFSQSLPILGGILADSYLGNVKTIFYFSIPYAIGYLGLFSTTLPYLFSIHSLVYASLILIAIGNGVLRAVITSLGANQFTLPQQKYSLDRYFSAYYFFYYAGILIGKILPPYIRTTVLITPFCVEKGECYTSVFGLIALTFIVSFIIFLCGLKVYKRETPTYDNTMLKIVDCVSYAVFKKLGGKAKASVGIMDNAVGRYSSEFVNDVKILLNIIKLFLPLPIFYALLAQQDSTFTFQATLLDTNILGIQIEADQFKALGPILLLLLIPLWQKIVNPMLEKCGVHLTSLECVFLGGLFASLSFICAGFLQYFIFLDVTAKAYSIMWQFPQFLFIMIAEMLISVPGLKHAYTFAPNTMKGFLTAIFFVNNALGNLLVVTITQLGIFKDDNSMEFFFYAFLMIIGAIIIKIMSDKQDDDEQTIETFIYVDEVQLINLEENTFAV